ncbi:nucleotidyltransferase domain-containing protein [Geoalkalibacter halelectricus]|uniref:Nucleotidyltransferase domain-containing protein n=1 Tax=Geoalkalibacter halelectricus TaxID=2847045 RepID=A0ABY5ZHM6_9BACT|nr:nucleotidyltransferase domain-containing protein [Geoalkalibacter halelectricus]MDO3377862.1 nucleotidyltransferase domain-containing protein [Geoalkalibacter halelectricus]UWZ77954.1 nucleotidyltransferase domain-containing protein [Geoalkalibacter halelectricus]
MNKAFGLPAQDRQKIISVFQKFPEVERVVIYGSRAKGNYRPASDIDLTIMSRVDWQTFLAIENALDDVLLPYKIDLSIYDQIDNPDLIDHIQRVGAVFYEKESGK